MTGAVLAIDQGTTNTKALLIGEDGGVVSSASVPLKVTYPRAGWAEAASIDIWHSVEQAVAKCLSAASDSRQVAAIGISNQRESILLWHRGTGEPLGPCVIWQCRRSTEWINRIRTPELEELVRARTGLGLDPLFPAAKIAWLLDEVPQARELAAQGLLCAGTVDSWLLYKLTGGRRHLTEPANASRTQLFDIHAQQWDGDLCDIFTVPRGILADIVDSDAEFGATAGCAALPDGIPVRAMIGDSHAALFGHGVREPGDVKATYGTGSSLMTLNDRPVASAAGLSTTVAWRRDGSVSYALEGNITVSGHAATWAAGILGLKNAEALSALASSVADSDGVVFVPALAGLGAPHWKPEARGIFAGLSLSTEPAHLARATLEAIAFQIADVFSAMEQDLGRHIDSLRADGGASGNRLLMQIQADILGRPIRVNQLTELSAFGAMAMAATASGFWSDSECLDLLRTQTEAVMPQIDGAERTERLAAWHSATGVLTGSAH